MLTKQFWLITGQARVSCAKLRGSTSNPSAELFQTIQGATKSRIWCSGKAAPAPIQSLKQHRSPDGQTDRTCKILVHSNSNSAGCKCAFGAIILWIFAIFDHVCALIRRLCIGTGISRTQMSEISLKIETTESVGPPGYPICCLTLPDGRERAIQK